VNEVIGPEIRGADASNQADVDERLRALDGTENKARLGANAILGASLAVARAAAASAGVPLFRRLAPVLAEDDWDGWRPLTERLGGRIQLVGDDIFVTNPAIIRRAIAEGIGDAALIKLNQIGTVSETLEAIAIAKEAGYGVVVSHRSGETADDFTADLAGATAAGQLKSGAPARGTALGGFRRHAGSPRPGDPSPG
jgi:enolase